MSAAAGIEVRSRSLRLGGNTKLSRMFIQWARVPSVPAKVMAETLHLIESITSSFHRGHAGYVKADA